MTRELVLGNVMVDCFDGNVMQKFYGELTGWEQCVLYGLPAVKSSTGIVFLFNGEADYAPPVWPEQAGKQQKEMHFDFQVPNVAEYVKIVQALGGVLAEKQYGGEDFVTMLDPSGHPLCLCKAD